MGSTNRAQDRCHEVLAKHFAERTEWLPIYVQQPTFPNATFEKTTRSRSILFLALGVAIAAGYDTAVPLNVAENGLISLNPPLTAARMGSLSTRTTHPHFIALFRRVLHGMEINVQIRTPYAFQTKGEMATRISTHLAFSAGVHDTVSCSHPDVGRYQGISPGQHCGYCVPCIIRRAALAAAGLDDPSRYLMDIHTNRPQLGSDTARDLRAFEMAIRRFAAFPPDRRPGRCPAAADGRAAGTCGSQRADGSKDTRRPWRDRLRPAREGEEPGSPARWQRVLGESGTSIKVGALHGAISAWW